MGSYDSHSHTEYKTIWFFLLAAGQSGVKFYPKYSKNKVYCSVFDFVESFCDKKFNFEIFKNL